MLDIIFYLGLDKLWKSIIHRIRHNANERKKITKQKDTENMEITQLKAANEDRRLEQRRKTERRGSKRIPGQLTIYFLYNNQWHHGQLFNISKTGAQIFSSCTCNEKIPIVLKIGDSSNLPQLSGRTVWCENRDFELYGQPYNSKFGLCFDEKLSKEPRYYISKGLSN